MMTTAPSPVTRRSHGSLLPTGGELVYKAAGGKQLPTGRSVARAIKEEFANQEAGARRSDSRLQQALYQPILSLLRRSAQEQLKRGDEEYSLSDLARELVRMAKLRSIATAGSVNDTTASIKLTMALQGDAYEGQGPYADYRVARIGLTEASWATHAAEEAVHRLRGKKRWTWRAAPNCCPECSSLDGKTVKIGEDFVTRGGQRAKHPPLHPHCYCACPAK